MKSENLLNPTTATALEGFSAAVDSLLACFNSQIENLLKSRKNELDNIN